MDTCASCGAGLASGAAWCGQCFAQVGSNVATMQPGNPSGVAEVRPFGWRPTQSLEALPAPRQMTRWRKTNTTFGPVGRILLTLSLVIPLAIMLVGGLIGDFFALGGAFVWAVVIMPWALKDIWRAGMVTDKLMR